MAETDFFDVVKRAQAQRAGTAKDTVAGAERPRREDSLSEVYREFQRQRQNYGRTNNGVTWGGGGQSGAQSKVANALGGILGAQAAGGAAPAASGGTLQAQVRKMARHQFGWADDAQWNALYDLIRRESGWNPTAQNPTSTAYGLFQFLDSTRKNYGISRSSPLEDQIRAGLQYIKDRYQNPVGALNHWLARKPINGRDVGHWY